jgi:hypothetical protein
LVIEPSSTIATRHSSPLIDSISRSSSPPVGLRRRQLF